MTKISKDNPVNPYKGRAFTLIELIIVLLIIAGLATLGIQQFQNMVWKARFAEVYQNVGIIARAEKIYYMMHDKYANELNSQDENYLGKGIPAGSTLIQQQLGVSFPEASLFQYLVEPDVPWPNSKYIFFRQSAVYDYCWYYNYVTGVWSLYGGGDPGPGCKYFVPPSG